MMDIYPRARYAFAAFAALALSAITVAEQRLETFDHDPGWDGHNNRPSPDTARTAVQDFGYAASGPGGAPAIGGLITPDGNPAYYAKPLPPTNLEQAFSASGVIEVKKGAGNTLLGFFNHDTINEWRTPNSLAFRINGRGDFFHVHFEYATSQWRAGASVIGRHDFAADRVHPLEILSEGAHTWSLAYDPNGNGGAGAITATFDGHMAVCNLSPGHKADGAAFDRFGLLNVVKHADGPGEFWIREITVNGAPENLASDPGWEGFRNRLTYTTDEVRPRFNFGYTPTHFAGGQAPGEIGGLFFRGDCRYPERLAYYGAPLGPLTLDRPLRASGKVSLRRAVSDSTTLFGFFHAEHSVFVNPSQNSGAPMNFLGIAIEGPSAEGFYVYPAYRVHGEGESRGMGETPPRIFPNGESHTWTLEYDPNAGDGAGEIAVTLDGAENRITFGPEHKATGAQFNRFGFITPWIDGNGQVVYFDDLEFTWR